MVLLQPSLLSSRSDAEGNKKQGCKEGTNEKEGRKVYGVVEAEMGAMQ
jgi:hypothetical protein